MCYDVQCKCPSCQGSRPIRPIGLGSLLPNLPAEKARNAARFGRKRRWFVPSGYLT